MEAAVKATPRDFAEFVEKNLEIPTIPDVAARALRAMGNPKTDGPTIAGIIGRDQGLTTRVLQLSNSAAYGLTRKVTNLEHAAMILGFNRLKTLVISASCRQLYRRFGWLEMELWLHSVACAGAAHMIANSRNIELASEAFVAGLMHDVGKVVMNNAEPERFRAVVERWEKSDEPPESMEREAFGFSHSEVGALLIRRWELASELETCVLMHHDQELLAMEPEDIQGLTHSVVLANRICRSEGLGGNPAPSEVPLDEHPSAVWLGITAQQLPGLIAAIREAFEADQQLMR